jgi:hypothetical protein
MDEALPSCAPLVSMPRRLADLDGFVRAKNVRRTFFALMRRIARSSATLDHLDSRLFSVANYCY